MENKYTILVTTDNVYKKAQYTLEDIWY